MNDYGEFTARAYHEATKHRRGFVAPTRHIDASLIPKQYKRYVGLPSFALPPPDSSDAQGFDATLATLLHFTAGIIRRRDVNGRAAEFRAASCTGALYHVEIYVVCGDAGGIPAGVYHYDVPSETLRQLRMGDHRPQLAPASANESILTAPATLVFTSTFWRNAWRYEERAYRHVFWDTGTMLANLLSITDARDLDAEVLTGFVDHEVATLLGLNTVREVPVCVVPIEKAGRARSHSVRPSAAVHSDDALAPVSLHAEPLSKTEIEYPLIWRTHEAANLPDPHAVTGWRDQVAMHDPLSSQGEGEGGEVIPYRLPTDETPESLITRRGSARRFKPDLVTSTQLNGLLSAAASYIPLDVNLPDLIRTDLVAHAVEGLAPGAFHVEHTGALATIRQANLRSEASTMALDQTAAGDAGLNLYFTAAMSDIYARLGDRGYRVAQLSAGIRSGRLYLVATALGLRATGLTFYDDEVANALGLDSDDTVVLMLMAMGRQDAMARR